MPRRVPTFRPPAGACKVRPRTYESPRRSGGFICPGVGQAQPHCLRMWSTPASTVGQMPISIPVRINRSCVVSGESNFTSCKISCRTMRVSLSCKRSSVPLLRTVHNRWVVVKDYLRLFDTAPISNRCSILKSPAASRPPPSISFALFSSFLKRARAAPALRRTFGTNWGAKKGGRSPPVLG